MDNIGYGSINVTDGAVIEAAKKAHAHAFITKLPQGYGALVAERGVKLAAGQRQRIAIARAILKHKCWGFRLRCARNDGAKLFEK